MGVANAQAIRDQMLAGGRRDDTPVAVIEWGTRADQRVVIGTLATLPDAIARAGLRASAVIVIGETVRLRSTLEWFDPSNIAALQPS
jgi:uroporphyrinogen III methyltransferase / synthase